MMRNLWIRSPSYDGLWFLSGIPIGAALLLAAVWMPSFVTLCPSLQDQIAERRMCVPTQMVAGLISIWAIVLLDMGHNLAPMALAWSHREFRQVMLKNPLKYIALPLALLAAGTGAGIAALLWDPSWTPFINSALIYAEMFPPRAENPFWWLVLAYVAWNFYHFSKQNFGVLSIYRRKDDGAFPTNQRRFDLVFAYVVQTAVAGSFFLSLFRLPAAGETLHLLYFLLAVGLVAFIARDAVIAQRWWTPRTIFAVSQAIPLLLPGLMTVASNGINHWLVSIGLAAHIAGRRRRWVVPLFAFGIIVVGILLGGFLFHKTGVWSWNPREMIVLLLPYTGFRLAMGFVHFLYDRWLYKFSDSRVRETIGRDVFMVIQNDRSPNRDSAKISAGVRQKAYP